MSRKKIKNPLIKRIPKEIISLLPPGGRGADASDGVSVAKEYRP